MRRYLSHMTLPIVMRDVKLKYLMRISRLVIQPLLNAGPVGISGEIASPCTTPYGVSCY